MKMAVLGITLTSVDNPLNSVSVWLVVTIGGTGFACLETAAAVSKDKHVHMIQKLPY